MNAAVLTRDPFMPRPPRGRRLSLALALFAHALLIAGLAFSVDWHSAEPNAVEAELWSAVPRRAAPREAAPEPPRQEVRAATPPAPQPPPVKSQPAPPPQVDPQIAVEQARKLQAQRDAAEQEQARRDKVREAQQRQAELAKEDQARKKALAQQAEKVEAKKAESKQAESRKADQATAAQQAAARAAYLKRMQGLAGASGDSNSTGTALKSSGPSSSYAGRIMARIKPNIVFSDAVDGNPSATVEVKVAPDGTITGRRLVQSSGAKAWDDAVLRAIDRTDGLPRDIDGRVQPVMLITFKRD